MTKRSSVSVSVLSILHAESESRYAAESIDASSTEFTVLRKYTRLCGVCFVMNWTSCLVLVDKWSMIHNIRQCSNKYFLQAVTWTRDDRESCTEHAWYYFHIHDVEHWSIDTSGLCFNWRNYWLWWRTIAFYSCRRSSCSLRARVVCA